MLGVRDAPEARDGGDRAHGTGRRAPPDAAVGIALVSLSPASVGRIVYATRMFAELVGLRGSELAGRQFEAVSDPLDLQRGRLRFAALARGEIRSFQVERRVASVDPDGGWVKLTVSSLTDGECQPPLAVVAAIDISSRRNAIIRLARTGAELRRSNQELEELAAIAAHDLAVPLKLLARRVGHFADDPGRDLDHDARELIATVLSAATRMQTMLDGMLAVAQPREVALRQEVDMAATAGRAIGLFGSEICETGARVTCGALPVVRGDGPQLERVLENLISNALKYAGPAAPEVSITARNDPGEWRFTVEDRGRGLGLGEDVPAKIFEPFRRCSGDDTVPGAGLGLAICKRIVARHGGRIWARSQRGGGTAVHFTIPDSDV